MEDFTFEDFVGLVSQSSDDPALAIEAWELFEAGELSIEEVCDNA